MRIAARTTTPCRHQRRPTRSPSRLHKLLSDKAMKLATEGWALRMTPQIMRSSEDAKLEEIRRRAAEGTLPDGPALTGKTGERDPAGNEQDYARKDSEATRRTERLLFADPAGPSRLATGPGAVEGYRTATAAHRRETQHIMERTLGRLAGRLQVPPSSHGPEAPPQDHKVGGPGEKYGTGSVKPCGEGRATTEQREASVGSERLHTNSDAGYALPQGDIGKNPNTDQNYGSVWEGCCDGRKEDEALRRHSTSWRSRRRVRKPTALWEWIWSRTRRASSSRHRAYHWTRQVRLPWKRWR